MGLNWNVDSVTAGKIMIVADIYMELCPRLPGQVKKLNVMISLTLAHENGCPLDFEAMARGRREDLAHDVGGVIKNLDHETGRLMHGFTPRYAIAEVDESRADGCPYCGKYIGIDEGGSITLAGGKVCLVSCPRCLRTYRYQTRKPMELQATGYDWLCEVCDHQNEEQPEVEDILVCDHCGAEYKAVLPGE